jgi:RES domain-containing protein
LNIEKCSLLTSRPETGTWFRAIPPYLSPKAIETAHSKIRPSRFSFCNPESPGPEILYLAENHQVALYEVEALYGSSSSPVPNPAASFAAVAVKVSVQSAVDLTDFMQTAALQTSLQELTGNWRSYAQRARAACAHAHPPCAPTQELGKALYEREDIEGFIAFSAKAIFPGRLNGQNSWVEYNYIEANGDAKSVRIPAS